MSQHLDYNLSDLHPYIRRHEIPLKTETPLSKIGSIIREYLHKPIEFKVNCRVGINDRLISCCTSTILPLTISSSLSSRKKNIKSNYSSTDFYISFNIDRSQSTKSYNEPNAVLFKYPTYSNSTSENKQMQRGIQLDFLAKKQLKFMVMATFIKPNNYKKRRDSSQPINYPPTSPKLLTSQSKPLLKYKRTEHIPNTIDNNLAIIYPQDNLLWSYYKNKAKIIEHNAWLPIVSLWRQNESNMVYMLRGQINMYKKMKKHKKRWKRGRSHIRSHTPSAPIPNLSSQELLVKKRVIEPYKMAKKSKIKNGKHICKKVEVNKHRNPCKFYKIVITEKEIICENLFDFPYLNITHELTWFDINTQSLLIVINNDKNKCIQLQIIKHKNISLHIPQSTTKCYKLNDQKKLSSSQLFHIKLENETIRLRLLIPKKYLYLFQNCKCLRFFYYKQSNSYILLLEKYDNDNDNDKSYKILLKLKINFITTQIEHISYGIVNDKNNNYNIIGYDYNRSLLIIDTLYEPLNPLSTNAFGNNGKMKKVLTSKPSNIYYQYNKWFSFASSQFVKKKYQVITKKFIALSINDFVHQWKHIYDYKINKRLKIIN